MLRALAVAIVPVVLWAVYYIWTDPYHTVRVDASIIPPSPPERFIESNSSAIAEYALSLAPDSVNAFIMGASIASYFEVDEWEKQLPAGSRAFHFNTSDEGAGTLLVKVDWLLKHRPAISHILLILDPISIEHETYPRDSWSMLTPRIAGYGAQPSWQYAHFRNFTDGRFQASYLPWKLTGEAMDRSRDVVFHPQPMEYRVEANEESIPMWDSLIRTDSRTFYSTRNFPQLAERRFTCRDTARITPEKETLYRAVAERCRNHGIDIKVIVTPTLRLDTLSRRDQGRLEQIFGSDRLFNFTVRGASIALEDTNWYDSRHFRAPAARKLLRATVND